ncbi:MAG: type 4a pilus biogenesis protein PilO [Gallionella sp.]|nr:type 4a pilus biogenesis protein PilO [Gallionella sp.]
MNLEDLKNLNPKTPGSWPWAAKILAFAALFSSVVVAGALLDWKGQWEALNKVKQEEVTLKETFLAKKKEAINLALIKKQLQETKESLGALLKQLPSKSEMDALLTDINQAGLGRGLQFELFRPGAEAVKGAFAEQPITIKITGSYDDIGKFSSDIAMLPRIVTLKNIAITPGAASSALLTMDATAITFRYLDEAELASQKKPADKGKGKAKAGAKK